MTNNQTKTIDIADIITNLTEITPEVNKLSFYINQKLILKSFETVESKVKDKDGNSKETVILSFYDEKNIERKIKTSAKYIILQLKELIRTNPNFNSENEDSRLYVKVKLTADEIFGEYRNFYFTSTK